MAPATFIWTSDCKSDDIACSAKGIVMAGRRVPRPWRFEPIPGGYRVIDANGLALAHVYGEPPNAIAISDRRLTNNEAEKGHPGGLRLLCRGGDRRHAITQAFSSPGT
jgi:hypothetical protein